MVVFNVAKGILTVGIVLCACVALYALLSPGVPAGGGLVFVFLFTGLLMLVEKLETVVA